MPKYVVNNSKSFINPYNFVRPSSEVCRGKASETRELVTGRLHCKLYIKTPLVILDTDEENITRDKNGHPHYNFFKTSENGSLTIPGSSIRGCVRSMYETLTNSCFATLHDNAYLSNRVATNDDYKPAILIKDDVGWSIYDAERLSVDTNSSQFEIKYDNGKRKLKYNGRNFSFGDCVNVNISDDRVISMTRVEGNTDYVLYIGEPFGTRKQKESVFKKGKHVKIDSSSLVKAINGLEYSIELYGKKTINRQLGPRQHTGYASYYDAKQRGIIPIWCKKNSIDKNGNVMDISLSMAAIGRKVYKNTVNDLIGQGLVACHVEEKNREDTLCPACSLFGTAKGSGFGSHVRFTDAVCTDDMGEKTVETTLIELGTPRTGFLPFYALNGIDYDNNGANINGRKFYWHNLEAANDSSIYTTTEKTERNATVEILKKGVFEFDVYFDEISRDQLETLKWTLALGENSKDGKQCFKIGHGKPIGLGSVKICISEQMIREVGKDYSYTIHKDSEVIVSDGTGLMNDSAKKQIQMITDLEFLKGYDIRYPYIDTDNISTDTVLGKNDAASHKWFSEAKGVRAGEHAILLPDIARTKDNPLHPYSISAAGDNHGNRACGNSGTQNNRGSNRSSSQKINVRINKISKDKNDTKKYIAYFDDGIVFNVPAETKIGDLLTVKVTKTKDTGYKFTEFISKG